MLAALGIFASAAIMSLGWVLCIMPGMCRIATRLIQGGAAIATITMLGFAVSGAALGIGGMTWARAIILLIVAGVCLASARLMKSDKGIE